MHERRYLWIVNNFLHDLATGVWAACVLVAWLLAGRLPGMPTEAIVALRATMGALLQLGIAALVVIGATGGVRLGYWRAQATDDAIAEKRRALIVKHVLFGLVYAAGTAWLWILVR